MVSTICPWRIGIRKISANASAIGKVVKAITEVRLPMAPVSARNSHSAGCLAITSSRKRSSGFFRNGTATSISNAPRHSTS